MKTRATPRPWKTRNMYRLTVPTEIWQQSGPLIASTHFLRDGQEAANAALIVRCVNQHDALVEALEALLDAVPEKPYWFRPNSEGYFEVDLPEAAVDKALAALDAAKEATWTS